MEAEERILLKNGAAYDYLFPKPHLRDTRVKRGAVLEDTIQFIPVAVHKTKWQTKAYTEKELKGLSVYDACEKLWHFLYEHIKYKKDEEGREQIRSPARAWHDRFRGIDCDCYSTFISTVLCNLGVPHTLRIAKYDPLGRFQHIYPIVPLKDGSYITIDCVLNQFNKEQPYVEIKDTKMDLEFLDGIDSENITGTDEFVKGHNGEVFGMEGMFGLYGDDDLGLLKKLVNKGKIKSVANAVNNKVLKPINNKVVKPITSKGLHHINKLNPATVLLRNGLLATLKLNMMNVAENLKWSYLSPQDAAKRGMNIGKYNKLKGIREKLEKIFHLAGGEPSNFKKAILTGRGNSKKEVVAGLEGMNENTPLSQLLESDIFYSENLVGAEDVEGLEEQGYEIVEQLNGIDDGQPLIGLGEPATASIAAATATITTIAGLIKGLGNLFDSSKKTAQTVVPQKGTPQPTTARPPAIAAENQPATRSEQQQPSATPFSEPESNEYQTESMPQPNTESQIVPTENEVNTTSNMALTENRITAVAQQGFWDKNKNWLKPTLIGVAGVGVIYLGYRMFSPSSTTKKNPPKEDLSGVNPATSKSSKKGKNKSPDERISKYIIQD